MRSGSKVSGKELERATTVYYKGRAWVEARLSDADVIISVVSVRDVAICYATGG